MGLSTAAGYTFQCTLFHKLIKEPELELKGTVPRCPLEDLHLFPFHMCQILEVTHHSHLHGIDSMPTNTLYNNKLRVILDHMLSDFLRWLVNITLFLGSDKSRTEVDRESS